MSLPLPPHDPAGLCPKCSGETISVTFHPQAVLDAETRWPCMLLEPGGRPLGEHLCRRCGTCGFAWCEAAADAYAPE
jgi:hypothetical protein